MEGRLMVTHPPPALRRVHEDIREAVQTHMGLESAVFSQVTQPEVSIFPSPIDQRKRTTLEITVVVDVTNHFWEFDEDGKERFR